MAYQQIKRVSAIEAKRNPRDPIEDFLADSKLFKRFLHEHGLDIDELKKQPRLLAAIPVNVLKAWEDWIDTTEAKLTAEDPDWKSKVRAGIIA